VLNRTTGSKILKNKFNTFNANICFVFRFKILNSLLELEGKKRVSHPLTSSIEYGRDKSGMATSILRVPFWKRQEAIPSVELPGNLYRDAYIGPYFQFDKK